MVNIHERHVGIIFVHKDLEGEDVLTIQNSPVIMARLLASTEYRRVEIALRWFIPSIILPPCWDANRSLIEVKEVVYLKADLGW